MITTLVSVKASGLSRIYITGTVYGKPLYTQNEIAIPCINALDDEFGFAKIQINRRFAVSDIIRILENIEQVDRVEIAAVNIYPFARPATGTNSNLNIVFLSAPVSTIRIHYSIIYNAPSNSFQVLKETTIVGNIPAGGVFTDANVSMQLNSGSYAHGSRWEFEVTPSYPAIFPQSLMEVKDFTAPIVDVDPLVDASIPRTFFGNIQFVTQSIVSNCTPPCE
jgi:hypothetical protein